MEPNKLSPETLVQLIARYSPAGLPALTKLFGDFERQEGVRTQTSEPHRLSYCCAFPFGTGKPVYGLSIPHAVLGRRGPSKMLPPLDQLEDCPYTWLGLYLNCCAVLAGETPRKGPALRLILRAPGNRLSHQEFKFAPELVQRLLDEQKQRYEPRAARERRVLQTRQPDTVQQSLF